MIFQNRRQAGLLLADKLQQLKLESPKTTIAAIPRGGIVVSKAIAEKLALKLTVIVIKKLGAPANSELAIGATASHGKPVLDHWLIGDLKVTADYLKGEILKKRKEAAAREKFLGVKLDRETFLNKNVIVVDDGLATGQTAKAAAKIIRQLGAVRLILAVPCAPPQTLDLVRADYDQVICLEQSQEFWAVGQYYQDFRPVEDKEVRNILNQKSNILPTGKAGRN